LPCGDNSSFHTKGIPAPRGRLWQRDGQRPAETCVSRRKIKGAQTLC
jgi:hypothetical protein